MSEESNDKVRFAAALRYRGGDGAPQVVAKGERLIADEIVRRAMEAGIAIHASAQLAALVREVPLDHAIPPQLYRVIAELLAWVYRIEQRHAPLLPLLPLLPASGGAS